MKTKLVKVGDVSGLNSFRELLNGNILRIILEDSDYGKDFKIIQKGKKSFLSSKDSNNQWVNESVLSKSFVHYINTDTLFEVYEEQEIKWYDDIPKQGVLCWCYDNHEALTSIEVITQYKAGFEYKYLSDNERFKNATPLTNDEIKRLFLRDDEN